MARARTAAQRAASQRNIKIAQRAAWKANKGRRKPRATLSRNVNRRHYTDNPKKRGVGLAGLSKNTIPYARVNKHSQTGGFNTGTIIPFTGKRIAFGGYFRVENTSRRNALDTTLGKIGNKVARKGTKPGAAREWFNKNVHIDNPGVRAKVGGAQVRLGTSRSSGPTIIVRRGSHKTIEKKSRAGLRQYNTRMVKIKKARKARRSR